jgi:hypothetical protein
MLLAYPENVSVCIAAKDYLHSIRNGFLLLAAAAVFLACAA